MVTDQVRNAIASFVIDTPWASTNGDLAEFLKLSPEERGERFAACFLSVTPKQERRARDVPAELFQEMLVGKKTFWEVVQTPYMNRNITRADVRAVVRLGLEETRGNYKLTTRLFNIHASDYKRFLNFLRKHGCALPFKKFREMDVGVTTTGSLEAQVPVVETTSSPAPPSVEAPKPPAPLPAENRAATGSGVSFVSRDDVPPSPRPVSPATPSLGTSRQVLLTLFYSGGQRHVNLSRNRLLNAVPSVDPPEVLVRNALRDAREHWRMSPQGSEEKRRFIRFVHNFRRDFGSAAKIEDALRLVRREDTSKDPVSLGF